METKHRDNIIARYWRGEFSLGVSYWLFGFVGNLAAGMLVFAIVAIANTQVEYQPTAIFLTFVAMWGVVCVVAVWQLVGVWRAANNHIDRRISSGGKGGVWGNLAKVAVIIGLLRLIGLFVQSGLPGIEEVTKMAFLDDPDIPPYSIRLLRDGTEIEIVGGFKYGLNSDLEKVLAAAPLVQVLHLDSLGGRIGEASKTFQTVRRRGLETYVSNSCASACTVAFAGGSKRWIANSAKLGFHGPAFPGMSTEELALASSDQQDMLLSAGISSAFIDRALSVPSEDIWVPSTDELLAAHVITGVASDNQFGISGLGANLSREKLASQLKAALPALSALEQLDVAAYDRFVDVYYSGYMAGETQAALVSEARKEFVPIIQKYRTQASDETTLKLGQLLIDQYQALAKSDARLCYLYATSAAGTDDVYAHLPDLLIQQEIALEDQILRTATHHSPVPEETMQSYWDDLGQNLATKLSDRQMDLLKQTDIQPELYAEYCGATAIFFSGILELPPDEAAALIRNLFSQT